jgi:hypothetical protein
VDAQPNNDDQRCADEAGDLSCGGDHQNPDHSGDYFSDH